MNKYEIMFIIKSTLEEEERKKIADELQGIFKSNNSKVINFRNLGIKRFAYPINKQVNGNYFLMQVETTTEIINEFKRRISINENVVRHLIIKLDEV